MNKRITCQFIGTGSFIPERRVMNAEFLDRSFFLPDGAPLNPTDNARMIAKFLEITGIAERRWASDDLAASDLGAKASRAAVADADIDPETLDYVIVAHNFGDVSPGTGQIDTVPTLAARIKQKLGIENPACVAYDLPFGCPGWLQGVIQADAFLRSGQGRRALIVGTETLSRVIDPHDRDSMLYADGAGAVVLEAVEAEAPVGILGHKTRSDAVEHAQLLRMAPSFRPDAPADRIYLKMDGRKVYEYAVQTVPGVVTEMLQQVGLTLQDVDMLLAHQANAKMNQAILKRLLRMSGLECAPDGMMPMTISRLGNSSVATVPTVFDLVRRGALDGHAIDSGDVLVFASVGAGMNVNALVYRCP
ncbi:MAG: 3-oxoacyl-[acyl-carrier-protein] synthase III C-terminal domain-containing protein [Gemmatimonadota bacterium]